MLHDSFNYTGMTFSDHIVVADEPAYQDTKAFAKDRLEHTFKNEELDHSSIEVLRSASCITIRGKTIHKLPEWLPHCDRLKYLSLPVHLASRLDSESLPQNLETINFKGNGRIKIRDDFVHSRVERLMSDADAYAAFNTSSFPSLKHFHFLSDKKKRLLAELHRSNVPLVTVTISPFSNPTDLNFLSADSLKYLRLCAGQSPALVGIGRFTQITDVHLHNLARLESIEPLLKLESLQELSIGYCNRIQKMERIADLRSLRRLMFYGCSKVITDVHEQLFRGMKLDELVI